MLKINDTNNNLSPISLNSDFNDCKIVLYQQNNVLNFSSFFEILHYLSLDYFRKHLSEFSNNTTLRSDDFYLYNLYNLDIGRPHLNVMSSLFKFKVLFFNCPITISEKLVNLDFRDFLDFKVEFSIPQLPILLDPLFTYEFDINKNTIILQFNQKNVQILPNSIISDFEKAKDEIKLAFSAYFQNLKLRNPVVLFSGGVDSSAIAMMLKNYNYNPLLYSLGVDGFINKDMQYAREVSNFLDLKLNEVYVSLDEIEQVIPEVIKIIGSINVTKIEVGLVNYLLLKKIKETYDFCEIFTGLGSEEIFAGYERHLESPFETSITGLLNLYHRDLIRDASLIHYFGFDAYLPFLDFNLIKTALKVKEYKIYNGFKKYIFRVVAGELGLNDFAFRKKLAAQYGSSISKAVEKIAKKNGYKYKRDYITDLFAEMIKNEFF